MIDVAALVAAGIGPTQARQFEAPLRAVCARFRIDTPQREAAFVAQCAHESARLTCLEEWLYYRSAERICAIFRSCVPDAASAQCLACNPKALANRVYAGRNGNGDEASGDGWRYRGRGLIQLTGRANYARATAGLGRDYVGEPDRVLDPFDACLTAGWFWDAAELNALADAARIDDITRAINGRAMAGAHERRELYQAALVAFTPPSTLGGRTSTRAPLPVPAPAPSSAITKRAQALPQRARAALAQSSNAGLTPGAIEGLARPRRKAAKAAKPEAGRRKKTVEETPDRPV